MRVALLLALMTASCAAADVRLPNVPVGLILIRDDVLPSTRICVSQALPTEAHPWACLTVGELRVIARGKRAL